MNKETTYFHSPIFLVLFLLLVHNLYFKETINFVLQTSSSVNQGLQVMARSRKNKTAGNKKYFHVSGTNDEEQIGVILLYLPKRVRALNNLYYPVKEKDQHSMILRELSRHIAVLRPKKTKTADSF